MSIFLEYIILLKQPIGGKGMKKTSNKAVAVKIEKLPADWESLSLEAKYDLVNNKLYKLADIACDWSINIKLQSGGDGKNYSSYIEWTNYSCVFDSEEASYKHCQFVRKNPISLGNFSN